MNFLKIVYAVLLGLILACFIGLGIEAFYPTENFPECNNTTAVTDSTAKVQTAEQKKCEEDTKAYQARVSVQNRNVSIAATLASILFMAVSLVIFTEKEVFSNGFLLGAMFTLIYSVIRGMMSDDAKFRFIVISVGLLVILILGYIKFGKQLEKAVK